VNCNLIAQLPGLSFLSTWRPPSWGECGFGASPAKETEFLQRDWHTWSRFMRQRVTSSRGCLLRVWPGQAEAVCSGGPHSRGFSGSLPADGWRRESSCRPCSGAIQRCRSRTRGASTQHTNSSGDGSRFTTASFGDQMAASFQGNWSEPGLRNQLNQQQPSHRRSAACKRSGRPERSDI